MFERSRAQHRFALAIQLQLYPHMQRPWHHDIVDPFRRRHERYTRPVNLQEHERTKGIESLKHSLQSDNLFIRSRLVHIKSRWNVLKPHTAALRGYECKPVKLDAAIMPLR